MGAGIFDDSSARVDVFHCREALVISFIERQVDVLSNVREYKVVGETICEQLEKLARGHGISG